MLLIPSLRGEGSRAHSAAHGMTVWAPPNPQSPLLPKLGLPRDAPNHPLIRYKETASLPLLPWGFQSPPCETILLKATPAQFRPLSLSPADPLPSLEPLVISDLRSHLTPHPQTSAVAKVIPLFLAWPGI